LLWLSGSCAKGIYFCLLTWRQLIELAILSKWKIYDLAKKFLLRSDQQKVFTTIYLKDETQEKRTRVLILVRLGLMLNLFNY
jgi:hypothetical protein